VRRCLFLLALLMLLPAGGLMAEPGSWNGSWECSAAAPDGRTVPWAMRIVDADGKLEVYIREEAEERKAEQVRRQGDELSFRFTVEEGTFAVRLHINGDTFTGTFKGTEHSGTLKGTRKSS